jgi:NAD(P)-dependent dehydrogenase (short-subunit alcohol dehydrogenase family)
MSDSSLYTLVTGASSGIGRATAVRLSQERKLILHGRNFDRLAETRDQCAASDAHCIWSFDLKDVEHLGTTLAAFLQEKSAGVECFIHCAGMVTILPMRAVDYRVVHEIMDVNFTSAVEIINVLLKKRVNRQNLKNILFVSSIWSNFGARGYSPYCASKGALDALMRALAVELASSIRVNSILPGAIQTQMAKQAFSDPEILAKWKQDYPLGLGEPDDIVNAVEFVISDRARWMTGQQIVVDGGRTVNMSLK